jgi:hypothetical protein
VTIFKGQVTRLNRDITARAIKEYLNLNVSTYTILRATKLFEWNKVNPNSNDSKKAAALERQLNGESSLEDEELEAIMAAEESDKKSQRQKKSSKKTKRPATGSANQSRVGKKYKKRKTAGASAGEEVAVKEGEKVGGEGGGVGGGGNASVTAGSEEAMENGHEFGDEDEDEEVEKIQLKPLVDQEMKKGIGFEKRPFERKTTKKRHSVNSIPG